MGPGTPQAGPVEAGGAGGATELSWQDREAIGALRRLALAQSQLATLTEAAAEAPPPPVFDAAALDELEQVHTELVAARDKARSRFGGGHARHRVAELEQRQQALLDRLGVDSVEAARHEAALPPAQEVVDPAVLAFAERELAEATRAWEELRALELPPVEAPPPDDGGSGAVADEAPGADVVELRPRQQAS